MFMRRLALLRHRRKDTRGNFQRMGKAPELGHRQKKPKEGGHAMKTILDLPLKATRKFKVFGPYAATAAIRIKEHFGSYKPTLRIVITNAITSTPPVPTVCTLYVSEVGAALNRDVDGTIYAADDAMIRYTDGATGEQHDIRLPKLPKRFVEHLQIDQLQTSLASRE